MSARGAVVAPEDVDRVLLQIGKVGPFQVFNCLIINMPILFSALYTIAYVFTAQELNYRCLIPECETADSGTYTPPWLPGAVPRDQDGTPEACSRYPRVRNDTGGGGIGNDSCAVDLFDTTRKERCSAWVYEPGQRSTIVNEWQLTCDDNKWKLTLVGTIGYIGAFVGMPLAGYLSDRFGRKTLFAWSWVLASVSGLIQSFSGGFVMFLCFEFLDSFCEAGVYGAGFLLALEFVGPRQRVLTTTLLSMFYSSGNAILGALAWAVRDWRWLLRAVYGGGLVFALPLWFTPESVRWLATRGRLEEADAIVARVADINRVAVKETLRAAAGKTAESEAARGERLGERAEGPGTVSTLISLFRSRTLLLRFVNCAYCWMANTFVYYGLSLNAVTLSGDQYVNFILSGLVEIPANVLAIWLQDYAGRRWSLAGTLIVSGVCCLGFLGVPADDQWLQVALYMLGKFAITISFIVIYVITAEMFPTNIRQSMVSYGSTFGRIGSMLAPQTPLLESVSKSLPLTLFGVVSLSSGLLALLFPETTGRPLPETLDEAERMGADQGCCCGPCTCSPRAQ